MQNQRGLLRLQAHVDIVEDSTSQCRPDPISLGPWGYLCIHIPEQLCNLESSSTTLAAATPPALVSNFTGQIQLNSNNFLAALVSQRLSPLHDILHDSTIPLNTHEQRACVIVMTILLDICPLKQNEIRFFHRPCPR